ncbi:MAG: alpha/beta hydrolase [Thermaerobacter sp.]|nr:alpha/beta hydrolase [Thermaerobacter sp.]
MQERWTEVGGRRIRLLAAGEGDRTVVLWPGLGGTAEAFLRQLREGSERGYRLAAIDPPGHGRSDRIPIENRGDVAAVWIAALDALGAEEAVLGGHSYGAVSALAALAESAELSRRTRGLLLYDGGYLSHKEGEDGPHAQCQRQLAEFTFATWEEFLDGARKESLHWDDDMEMAARAMMAERDGRIRLRIDLASCEEAMEMIDANGPLQLPRIRVGAAVLLRAGRPVEMEDERCAGAAALAEKVPGLQVQIMPGVTHELLDEDPTGVAEMTWAFLAGVDWT